MNERIREVWIKAAREDSDPDNWDTQVQFIERFAELIVAECAGFLRDTLDDHFAAEQLEQHFGVE